MVQPCYLGAKVWGKWLEKTELPVPNTATLTPLTATRVKIGTNRLIKLLLCHLIGCQSEQLLVQLVGDLIENLANLFVG